MPIGPVSLINPLASEIIPLIDSAKGETNAKYRYVNLKITKEIVRSAVLECGCASMAAKIALFIFPIFLIIATVNIAAFLVVNPILFLLNCCIKGPVKSQPPSTDPVNLNASDAVLTPLQREESDKVTDLAQSIIAPEKPDSEMVVVELQGEVVASTLETNVRKAGGSPRNATGLKMDTPVADSKEIEDPRLEATSPRVEQEPDAELEQDPVPELIADPRLEAASPRVKQEPGAELEQDPVPELIPAPHLEATSHRVEQEPGTPSQQDPVPELVAASRSEATSPDVEQAVTTESQDPKSSLENSDQMTIFSDEVTETIAAKPNTENQELGAHPHSHHDHKHPKTGRHAKPEPTSSGFFANFFGRGFGRI